MGYIYKITNIQNQKSYIGQTQTDPFRRFQRHLQDAANQSETKFHRAIRKYGITNWTFQILEEIREEKLNEREQYWINYFDSFNNGYNLTSGGQPSQLTGSDIHRKLNDNQIIEIQQRLATTSDSLNDIAQDYNVSLYCISDINTGRTWKNNQYNYPIRKRNERKLSYNYFILIIEMLNTHLFSMQHISEKLNIGNNTIGKINNGRYTKYQYPSHITKFPIHNYQKCKIVNSRVCTVDLYCNILLEYLKTNCTIKNYQKYQNKISQSLYNQIIRGEMPQYIQSFLQHPLEKHIPENIQILSDILNVYNKYK